MIEDIRSGCLLVSTIVTETESHYNPQRWYFHNFCCEKHLSLRPTRPGNRRIQQMPKANQSTSSNPDQPCEKLTSDTTFPKNKNAEGIPDFSAVKFLPKIIPFRDLCRCGDEVWIEHEGQLYRLRCTKQGKLLLTK